MIANISLSKSAMNGNLRFCISNDLKKLQRDFGTDFTRCMSFVDVGELANRRASWTGVRRWNLAGLCMFCLERELPKPHEVRLSDWEGDLNEEQVQYATDDAWVSLLVHDALLASRPPAALSPTLQSIPEEGAALLHHDPGLPSTPKSMAEMTAHQRVELAAMISEVGHELDSDWLLHPPAVDVDFINRLNREKERPFVMSRIKLDPFHFMDRYASVISKHHVLFGLFMACLRDAIFYLDFDDVAMRRAQMVQNGMSAEQSARVPKSFFTRKSRCRRSIPPRLELAVRIQAAFELFDGLKDAEGNYLITDKARNKHRACMEHVWSGCISDLPGCPMYFERGHSGGFPVFGTLRGTSQLESYHRWLRACIAGSRLSPDFFANLLAHFNYRWNIRCGHRSRGDQDFGTYSHWLLEAVVARSGDRAFGDMFPGLQYAMPVEEAAQNGIDLSKIGFHMPQRKDTKAPHSDDDHSGSSADTDDSVNADSDSDDDSDSGDPDNPGGFPKDVLDMAALQQSVAGDSFQAPITAMSPVASPGEMKLLMELVKQFTRSVRGKVSVQYENLAMAFNAELDRQRQADSGAFACSGLRPKSAAQVKDFFERVDVGLQVSGALRPVFDQYVRLRANLRDNTSAPPPAAIKCPTVPAAGCCGEVEHNCDPLSDKKSRAPRTCQKCKMHGRGRWRIRQTGSLSSALGIFFICSNPLCVDYKDFARSSSATATSTGRRKKSRMCPHCRVGGHGEFQLRQMGTRESMQFVCSNFSCPAMKLEPPALLPTLLPRPSNTPYSPTTSSFITSKVTNELYKKGLEITFSSTDLVPVKELDGLNPELKRELLGLGIQTKKCRQRKSVFLDKWCYFGLKRRAGNLSLEAPAQQENGQGEDGADE